MSVTSIQDSEIKWINKYRFSVILFLEPIRAIVIMAANFFAIMYNIDDERIFSLPNNDPVVRS